ncbi:hypothetical protein [Deinococcus irradiatisoli]|uniref:hypothetical protein n=1 Tax=Deinococcus irradiatisoli TaxID=2202254 RepID=UPI0011B1E034|nr:hypothetical protein [Deinococcus irradiatisoli]
MTIGLEPCCEIDDAGLKRCTDEQLLDAIGRRNERALLEVHRRYWSWAHAAAQRHRNTAPADAIDDAFFDIWKQAAAASRSILPARLWIVGMLDRSLARHQS